MIEYKKIWSESKKEYIYLRIQSNYDYSKDKIEVITKEKYREEIENEDHQGE